MKRKEKKSLTSIIKRPEEEINKDKKEITEFNVNNEKDKNDIDKKDRSILEALKFLDNAETKELNDSEDSKENIVKKKKIKKKN